MDSEKRYAHALPRDTQSISFPPQRPRSNCIRDVSSSTIMYHTRQCTISSPRGLLYVLQRYWYTNCIVDYKKASKKMCSSMASYGSSTYDSFSCLSRPEILAVGSGIRIAALYMIAGWRGSCATYDGRDAGASATVEARVVGELGDTSPRSFRTGSTTLPLTRRNRLR